MINLHSILCKFNANSNKLLELFEPHSSFQFHYRLLTMIIFFEIVVYTYVYLAGFSKRLSTVVSPVSRVPPSTNFPVSSSYKNRTCLNIRTGLDILDNRHPRKYPLACVVFNSVRPETRAETRVFLKS